MKLKIVAVLLLFIGMAYSSTGPVRVMFLDEAAEQQTHASIRMYLESQLSWNTWDLTGYKVRYFFTNDQMGPAGQYFPPELFFSSIPSKISVTIERCGGQNYALRYDIGQLILQPHGKYPAGGAVVGLRPNDAGAWYPHFFKANDFSWMNTTQPMENRNFAFYDANGADLWGYRPTWHTQCTPVWTPEVINPPPGTGNGRVEFLFLDAVPNLGSQQQTTVRIKMRNPGSDAVLVEKDSYYRYYFTQDSVNYTKQGVTTRIGPRIDAYWNPHVAELEACGPGKWSVKYKMDRTVLLRSSRELPGPEGSVLDIRMNHVDWPAVMNKGDDYSYLPTGVFQVNEKIALFSPTGLQLGGLPAYACPADILVSSSSSSSQNSSSSSSFLCQVEVTAGHGGGVVPTGIIDLPTTPHEIALRASANAGYRFQKWDTIAGAPYVPGNGLAEETVILQCGDQLRASFVPIPAQNYWIEDGCGFAASDTVECRTWGMGHPDIKKIWVLNDHANMYFLVQFCEASDFEADQFLYLDPWRTQGDPYDVRIKIDYLRRAAAENKSSLDIDSYNRALGKWLNTLFMGSGTQTPAYRWYESSALVYLPDGSQAGAYEILEVGIPLSIISGMQVRWWFDGNADDVATPEMPNIYHVAQPGYSISIDGNPADWVAGIHSATQDAQNALVLPSSSSSAISSSSQSSSSSQYQISSSSIEASSSSVFCPVGTCMENPLEVHQQDLILVESVMYLKLDESTYPSPSAWEYDQGLRLSIDNTGEDFNFRIAIVSAAFETGLVYSYCTPVETPRPALLQGRPYIVRLEPLYEPEKEVRLRWSWY